MKRILIFLCFPLFLSANAYFGDVPENFSAHVSNKSKQLTLEELGQLDLVVEYPQDYRLKEIDLASENESSEMQYTMAHNSLESKGEQSFLQNLSIQYEPQVEGRHALDLPILHFESRKDPSQHHTLYPPSIECEVKMSAEDPLEELEVAAPLTLEASPPVELDAYNKKVFFQNSEKELQEVHQKMLNQAPKMRWTWFVWAFVLSFAGYKIYQLVTKKRTIGNLFTAKENPKEKALRALKNLKAKHLPERGQYDLFYVEITQIIRQYIEGYYRIKAPEQTTQEFLQVMLGQSIFNEKINHYLTEFLKFADLVKFAKLHPKKEDCAQAEDAAENFILTGSEK